MGFVISSWAIITVACVVASTAYFTLRLFQERRFYRRNDLPQPPHHWFWGHLKLMGETMAALPSASHYQAAVTTIALKYNMPGVFYLDLWPAGSGQVIVTDPDVAQFVTVKNNHPKHAVEKWFMDPLIGEDNIFTSEGRRWKYLHKMLAPAFTVQYINDLRPIIAEEFMDFRSILHKQAESGQKFSLEKLALNTAFDVVGQATFGHSLNAKHEGSQVLLHFEAMCRAFGSTRDSFNISPQFFTNRGVKRERQKLDAVLKEMIEKRFDILVREKIDLSKKKGLSILDLALRDHVEEVRTLGSALDPAFLETAVTQVKTILVAGTGTTSDAICFAMMLLSIHPHIVQKLREEHDAVFTKGIDATYQLLQEEPQRLKKLDYTANVIKEVLRFYPVGDTARAEHPTEKFLPYQGESYSTAGKMVCPINLAMHMDDKMFPNAKKFDPDRYTRGDFPKLAWRPFERGPRGCLGQQLAMDELKLALLLTIRDFDFVCADLKPNKTPRVDWLDWDLAFGDRAFQEFVFEARPRDGMPMTVKKSTWSS